MRVVACMGFLAVCVGLVGCTGSGKKTALPKSGADDRATTAGPRDDGARSQPPVTATGDTGGVIAGRVIDNFNRPYSDIWVESPADGKGAPVVQKVETRQDGSFQIEHLRPYQTYHLIAQTKDGSTRQAGEVTVRAPAPKVVILVSQDRTPAIPGGGDTGLRPTIGQPEPLPPSGTPGPAASLGQPIPIASPDSASGSITPIRPDHFTEQGDPKRNRESPPVKLPNPFVPPPPAPPKPTPSAAPSGGGPSLPEPALAPVGVTQVPSCDRRGEQLYNFALVDRDGQPWEYKRNRRAGSKVTLIDFWGTWCGYCCASIKKDIVPLNDIYGRLGLEVIGIAYEQDRTFDAQVRRVNAAARDLHVNYKVLMGYGINTCPVARDFGIKNYPTLVLVNDKGQIIWSKEGAPGKTDMDELTAMIQKELGIRR